MGRTKTKEAGAESTLTPNNCLIPVKGLKGAGSGGGLVICTAALRKSDHAVGVRQ
jgi:hypothetical protein